MVEDDPNVWSGRASQEATNFIVGRCTASAIASASRKSFFCPLEYARTYFRGHQSRIVTVALQPAAQVMRADTGLHADQARRHVGKPRFDLAA